jgi:hypothetical protein
VIRHCPSRSLSPLQLHLHLPQIFSFIFQFSCYFFQSSNFLGNKTRSTILLSSPLSPTTPPPPEECTAMHVLRHFILPLHHSSLSFTFLPALRPTLTGASSLPSRFVSATFHRDFNLEPHRFAFRLLPYFVAQ